LGERGTEWCPWQILPQPARWCFRWSRAPSVVRRGEVDRGAKAPLERFTYGTQSRCSAVMVRTGCGSVAEDVSSALQGLLGADARQLTDAHEAAFTFDDRDGGRFAAAVHGIDLPVAQARAPRDDGGAFRDHPLAGEAATAVVGP